MQAGIGRGTLTGENSFDVSFAVGCRLLKDKLGREGVYGMEMERLAEKAKDRMRARSGKRI